MHLEDYLAGCLSSVVCFYVFTILIFEGFQLFSE